MITITKISNFKDFLQLNYDWNELLNRQPSDNSVFYTHEWFQCWWRNFGLDSELFILLARDHGKIIGIAPLMLKKVFMRGLPARVLSFIENGNSLHNNFILETQRKREALHSILQYVMKEEKRWDWQEKRKTLHLKTL